MGVPTAIGGSPRWIEAPTLSEWAQTADPDARCVAVGTGRWSSLLHAGHGLLVRFTEGTIPDFDRAVHGSPYLYDRRVPFLLMGPGVRPGRSAAPARTVDVAPTLAGLGGIPLPGVLDGKRLL